MSPYFLAPSDHVDLGDETSARAFVTVHVLPTFVPFDPASSSSGAPS